MKQHIKDAILAEYANVQTSMLVALNLFHASDYHGMFAGDLEDKLQRFSSVYERLKEEIEQL